ncbi:MAG: hypothetical protein ABIQ90_10020 [Polaromonas sp.]
MPENGPPQSASFMLSFRHGELVAAQIGRLSGQEAIAELLQSVEIRRSDWLPREAQNVLASPGTPGCADLLKRLGVDSSQLLTRSVGDLVAGAKLLQRAKEAFATVYGESAKAEVDRIVRRHDPATQADEFLQACYAELVPMLGQATARAMLHIGI